jgi:hypothetical protein
MHINIDHVTICGSSLDELQKAFANAGVVTEYGGPHANGVTHMALAGFEDGSYLELIAPISPTESASGLMAGWMKMMAVHGGPCAWAIRTANIQKEVDRLKTVGLAVTSPERGGRKTLSGTGLRWQTASLGPGGAGAILPFMIQDETSRGLRVTQSETARKAGITGVGAVIIGVRDLQAAISLFMKSFGWNPPESETHDSFGATLAYFPNSPVMLATPLDRSSWLASRLELFEDRPAAFLLRTNDLGSISKRLGLIDTDSWFGRKLAWFDESELRGARVGVIE